MADGIAGEFFDLKAGTDADLLAMQCGDFYEFFGDDAETVADELDLKVSQKSSHGSSYPMAGVPVDDLTPYLAALVERGYRVAVADQYETGGGHAREVTRVATPGTLLGTTDAGARYLAAVVRGGDGDGSGERGDTTGDRGGTDDGGDGQTGPYGLTFVDVTTGRFLVTAVPTLADARSELYRFDPAELLPGPNARNDDALLAAVREGTAASVTAFEAAAFGPGRAAHAVREQFGAAAADSVGLDDGPAVRAAGAALAYVADTGTGVLASITRLRTYAPDDGVELDATTQRNLELTGTMTGGDGDGGSLLATVDHTVTAPGGRPAR